jgi:hypothetical protein
MSKSFFFFLGSFLFYGMSLTYVQGQNNAAAGAFIRINRNANVVQINYNSTSKNGTAVYDVLGNTIMITTDNTKLVNSTSQNLGSFTISSENKNTFTVSLPAHPVTLKNTTNGNTLQVTGSQTSSQSLKDESGKNVRVVNLDGSLKIGSVSKEQSGVYTGTYPITFVYN